MKILFDVLPLIFFFAMYKIAGRMPDQGAAFATHWLGALVQGGVVGSTEAPALLATVVVLVATLVQVTWMKATGRKIDAMLWIGLALIVVFGGLTVWLHNQMFIMWKPSITYWLLGLVFWGSQVFFHKNLPRATLRGLDIELSDTVAQRLNFAYVAIFALMGLLNLWVVYFMRDYWVVFHTFVITGLLLAFGVIQGFYVNKHAEPVQSTDEQAS
jgi:intracellular septation protein